MRLRRAGVQSDIIQPEGKAFWRSDAVRWGNHSMQSLKVRHPLCGHTFSIESMAALPLSARATDDPTTYELEDPVDCPACNPPEEQPDW